MGFFFGKKKPNPGQPHPDWPWTLSEGGSILIGPTCIILIFMALPSAPLKEAFIAGQIQLPLGSLTIEVLHTPGHSHGSVTLKAGEALFTGDTLFAGDCGRTDLRGGSWEEILVSLGRLGKLEGNHYVLPRRPGQSPQFYCHVPEYSSWSGSVPPASF